MERAGLRTELKGGGCGLKTMVVGHLTVLVSLDQRYSWLAAVKKMGGKLQYKTGPLHYSDFG